MIALTDELRGQGHSSNLEAVVGKKDHFKELVVWTVHHICGIPDQLKNI